VIEVESVCYDGGSVTPLKGLKDKDIYCKHCKVSTRWRTRHKGAAWICRTCRQVRIERRKKRRDNGN
jgi:hypothetical protein